MTTVTGTSNSTDTSSTASSTSSSTTGTDALSSLSSNFNNFLQMLMAQLQNQDPTSPMDTNQFTTELVQFTSVQQQINTNTNLTTLIQATQSSDLLQANALVGQSVQVTSSQLSLQNGSAQLNIQPTTAGNVTVTISSASGVQEAQQTISATAGSNSFTWNGQTSSGTQLADGAYKVTVTDSSGAAVPFNVVGKVTGVQRSGSSVTLSLGAVTADLSTVQSVAQTGS